MKTVEYVYGYVAKARIKLCGYGCLLFVCNRKTHAFSWHALLVLADKGYNNHESAYLLYLPLKRKAKFVADDILILIDILIILFIQRK